MTSVSAEGDMAAATAGSTDSQTPTEAPSETPSGENAGIEATPRSRPVVLSVLGMVGLVALGLDLLTKQLALTHLTGAEPVRWLGGLLYLDLTRNPGAAFSIGTDYTFVFPIITVVVLVGIGWLARELKSVPWAIAMGLIVGGALGNLVDRIFRAPAPMHGHVVDFLSLFDEAGRAFPIFNVADSALFCGVTLAILLELTGRRRDGGREPSKRAAGGEDQGRRSSVRDSTV